MASDSIALALEVIRRSGRGRPADEVLKSFFLEKRRKSAAMQGAARSLPSAEVSRLVFNYYRWFGWLNTSKPLHEQIAEASELARRFRKAPREFSDADLLERTVPAWSADEVALSAPLVRAFQIEPKLWLRARRGRGREIARKLEDCEPLGDGHLADVLRYVGRQDVFRTSEFQSGDLQIQDVSSQAVGFLCEPKPGETWWDACAGEGGKTLHLSELMDNKGLIWASDRSDWRLRRLRARAGKARAFNHRVAPWDGGAKLPTKTLFDGVLVDAPCSGVGTWHRNPHARWTTTINDVRELASVQLNLLSNVARSIKPGGKLIYSVCTITRSETEAVANAFEQKFPQFQPLALPSPLATRTEPRSRHCFLPQDLGGNGMFVAAWRASK